MVKSARPKVAIVNFGMGNLFSVKHACERCGIEAVITHSESDILQADGVILPGVGAFGDAMELLRGSKLVDVLKETAESQKPLFAICLGMQLLMEESYEFGQHKGLGIVKGTVERLDNPRGSSGEPLKVPHIGWNALYAPHGDGGKPEWEGGMLGGLSEGEFMYFVHSYYTRPKEKNLILSTSRYGNIDFCSSFQFGNVFACQFHPERSGENGLMIYKNLAKTLNTRGE